MVAPLTLLSLNPDILREILAHLLLDTPRDLNRTSVLQTSSLLSELGLPLLYRVINLDGFGTENKLSECWNRLFCEGGLFTKQGGKGKLVFELKLGRARLPWIPLELDNRKIWEIYKHVDEQLDLPNCSSLTLSTSLGYDFPYLLTQIAQVSNQLPAPLQLSISKATPHQPGAPVCDDLPSSLATFVNDTFAARPTAIRTLRFGGAVWFLISKAPGRNWLYVHQLCFSQHSFEVLVVELEVTQPRGVDTKGSFDILLDPHREVDRAQFLKYTKRIELRLVGPLAGGFVKEFEGRWEERVARGLDAFERRIGSKIVFVGENGTQIRLVG